MASIVLYCIVRTDVANEYAPFDFWLGSTNLLTLSDKLVLCGATTNRRSKVYSAVTLPTPLQHMGAVET